MVVLTTSLFKVITVIVKNNLIRIIAHHKTKVTMVGFLEPRRCNSRAMAVILLAQLGVENSGCAPDFNLLNHDVSRLECRQRVVCRRLRCMLVKICVVDVNFGNMNTYFQQLSRGEVR